MSSGRWADHAAARETPLGRLARSLVCVGPMSEEDERDVEALWECFAGEASAPEARAVAASLTRDPGLLMRLSCDADPVVRDEVAGNPGSDAACLMRVVEAGGPAALRAAMRPELDPGQAAWAARRIRGMAKRVSLEMGPYRPMSRDYAQGNEEAMEVLMGCWSMAYLADLVAEARPFHPQAAQRAVASRVRGMHIPAPRWVPNPRSRSLALPCWHAAHAVAAGLAAGLDGSVRLGGRNAPAGTGWVERWWADPSVMPDLESAEDTRSAYRMAPFAHGDYLDSLDKITHPEMRPRLLYGFVSNPWASPERVAAWAAENVDIASVARQALLRRACGGVDPADMVRSFDLAAVLLIGSPRPPAVGHSSSLLTQRIEADPQVAAAVREVSTGPARLLLASSTAARIEDALAIAPARDAMESYRDPAVLLAWVYRQAGAPGLEAFGSFLDDYQGTLGELVQVVKSLG